MIKESDTTLNNNISSELISIFNVDDHFKNYVKIDSVFINNHEIRNLSINLGNSKSFNLIAQNVNNQSKIIGFEHFKKPKGEEY